MINIRDFFYKGDRRSILLKRNIASSFILKGFSILISFILVPMTIDYLNQYEYGVWLTLNSILSWIYIFDIGLGNGLRNKLTEALARGDYEACKKYVSTAFFCMAVTALIIFLAICSTKQFIDWYSFMNVDPSQVPHLSEIITTVLGFVCTLFVVKMIGTIYMAYQQPAINDLLLFLGNLLSLIIICVLTKTTDGSMEYVAICFSGAPVLIYLLAAPITFKKHPESAPSLKKISFPIFKDLVSLGINFMIIQIAGLIIFMTSNIIISRLFGPQDVTPYNIAYKYLSIVNMVFAIILSPFWSAITDAYAKDEIYWIKTIMNKMLKIWIVSLVLLVIMVISSKLVYNLWVGAEVEVPISLTIWLASYFAILSVGNLLSNIINGIGKLRAQLLWSGIQSLLFIPAAIFLGHKFGITGIAICLFITCAPTVILSGIQVNLLLERRAKGFWNH